MTSGKSNAVRSALVALVAAGAVGCGADSQDRSGESPVAASPGASSTETRIVRRRPEPSATPVARLEQPPAGTVSLVEGTFSDRLKVVDLRFQPGERPRVSGGLINRTDVSDLLALVVRADYYDADGRLVGSGDQSFDHGEAFHEEALRFTVRASEPAPEAVTARLSVPDLVVE